MIKAAKLIFIFSFLLLFAYGCKVVNKVKAENPLNGSEKVALNGSPVAYDFKLKDLKGSEISLSSYKGKKAVVLVFWTTWCPYCRDALKSLQSDSKSLTDMGVELLAINVGESESKVNKLVRSFNLSFHVLLDFDGLVADHYNLLGVPTYVVINKSGEMVFNGNIFTKERLKELMAE